MTLRAGHRARVSASERRRATLVGRPLAAFFHVEAAGGVVLLAATAAALVWANSPWAQAYGDLWATEIAVRVGSRTVAHDLRHWINDGLMALFFFTVGLEIKRELTVGALRRPRAAALPLIAAAGGMLLPALVYLAINPSGPARAGWAIPVATDIAFALGVLSLAGPRVPAGAKAFLLSLAIADDMGAVVIIAVAYTAGLDISALAAAVAGLAAMSALRRFRVWSIAPYAVLGVFVWLATLESGVHASVAGAVIGLLTPARPLQDAREARALAAQLPASPSPRDIRQAGFLIRESVSVAERLQTQLHPWSSFVVLPLFALANAGIPLDASSLGDTLASPIALGVAAGLAVGAPAGVGGATWLATRLGVADLPRGVGSRHIGAIAGLAGIGFTMSLFLTDLAFGTSPEAADARGGILAGSAAAALAGSIVLRFANGTRHRRAGGPPQPGANRPDHPTGQPVTTEVIADDPVPAHH